MAAQFFFVRTHTPQPNQPNKNRVADWFAQLNNKMGGDLKKIQTVGKYMIEVWKAAASGSVPKLMVRDWTGDGILDLFFTSVSSTGTVTLERLGYSSGRLVQKEKVTRTSVGKGWTLQ